MPSDHERNKQPEDAQEKFEQFSEEESSLELGAKILSLAGFEGGRNKRIVDSSYDKVRKNEKMPDGNSSLRHNYAYLSRLEKLIDECGRPMEKRIWRYSIKDDLLIEYDNIPDSYWETVQRDLRDNGYGSIDLNDYNKHIVFERARELQEESLQKWADYLGDERSPYPLWFKVYAWDGVTKIGNYNKEKKQYEKRNKTTVAPYPDPDAEILAGIFDVVNRYHGNNERAFYTKEGERNIDLEKIVSSGNFSKIYNAIQQDIAPIMLPPDDPADIRGEWVEYLPGEEDDIARAARGTGWCIASSATAREYLKYSFRRTNNNAKFIIFHLYDPKTGKLAKNGCASVRLDIDGYVAEISGLGEGQALNDSLVPTVEEKAKSLPGGEKYLAKFADKKMLIALDRKMENGQDLTKEELEFLYEINRPIETLDTYNHYDPRIKELRSKYGVLYALHAGVDANQLMSRMDPRDIAEKLDILLNHGADINQLISNLGPFYTAEKLDTLTNHGANIDINQLVSHLAPYEIAEKLDTLTNHGANIDINQLISDLEPFDIDEYFNVLLNHGADINQLEEIIENDV